jgi:excinuclease UvrABC nuclease subunit
VGFDDQFDYRLDWPPPVEEGKRPADALPRGGGVYLLTDEQDRFIQLSWAAGMKRVLKGRLLPEADEDGAFASESTDATDADTPKRSKRADLSRIVRRIRWQPAHGKFELSLRYLWIARELMPRDYVENLPFGSCWFVHIDPAAEIPQFRVSKLLRADSGVEFGPFSVRKDADRFVETLQDTFDLCRYHHILEQTPHGQACAYFEMGRCPAPCDGSVPMSEYRGTVADAVAFAGGKRQRWFEQTKQKMQAAASEMAFEKAAQLKQQIERAQSIEHAAFRLVRPIEGFRYLVLQRGRTRRRIKPFFVHAGAIRIGEEIKLKDVGNWTTPWLEAMKIPREGSERAIDTRQRSEQIWLVSHFLFKRETPGLFLRSDALNSPEWLAGMIDEAWNTNRQADTSAK